MTAPAINTHGMTINFGKHKGERYTRLPVGYLRWLIDTGSPCARIAAAELERRGVILDFKMELSPHCIDRASIRCMNIYWATRKSDDEGLYSWLHRMAAEALERYPKGTEECYYEGMKFAFHHGLLMPTLKTVMVAADPADEIF